MSVRGVVTYEVPPEQTQDFLNLSKEAIGHIGRLGGKNIKLFQALVAGPNTGQVVLTVDFDDLAAWGTFNQTFNADRDAQALVQKFSTAGAGRVIGRAIMNEITP